MTEKDTILIDTEDMGLAIALVTKGYELAELSRQKFGKRITFHFRYAKYLDTDAQAYWSGKLQVDAKAYWNESKNLKTRLYSLK